jgi:ribosomal protein S20
MTTYSYGLTLSDSEVIMLDAALKLMIKTCEENIAKGDGAPNLAHKNSAENVLSRLHDNMNQTSGNNF